MLSATPVILTLVYTANIVKLIEKLKKLECLVKYGLHFASKVTKLTNIEYINSMSIYRK